MGCVVSRFGTSAERFTDPHTINRHAVQATAVKTKTRSRSGTLLNAFAAATTANGAAAVASEAAANAANAACVLETARVVADTAAWVAALPYLPDVPLSRGGPGWGM